MRPMPPANDGPAELSQLSIDRHWRVLLFATLWAAVACWIIYFHHIAQSPGELSVTVNGNTYYGHPPALTLNESDPLSSRIMVGFLLAGLITALVSLKRRTVKRQTGPGVTPYVLGAMVIAFSLFGLIWGIASMGVVGALIVLSGRPLKN
jgi:hypothetical protein